MDIFIWLGFILLVFLFLALDLGVFNKGHKVMGTTEALIWTGIWIGISLLFNLLIFYMYEGKWLGIGQDIGNPLSGREAALKFLTGYLLEKSLSVDNIFVIAMIFSYFKVESKYQHDILFWGILGALLMRGVMIGVGASLMQSFSWLTYVFGAFLIFTAVKMLTIRQETLEPENNILVRYIKSVYPVTDQHEGKFIKKIDGKTTITTLFIVLIIIETTDLMFALDSIPAIFAVTTDAFLVFTSNIFAILGLRSLYFALAALMDKFRYLKMSLVFVLAFVGVKMILAHHYQIPTFLSLSIIVGMLLVGVMASLYGSHKDPVPLESPLDNQAEA